MASCERLRDGRQQKQKRPRRDLVAGPLTRSELLTSHNRSQLADPQLYRLSPNSQLQSAMASGRMNLSGSTARPSRSTS